MHSPREIEIRQAIQSLEHLSDQPRSEALLGAFKELASEDPSELRVGGNGVYAPSRYHQNYHVSLFGPTDEVELELVLGGYWSAGFRPDDSVLPSYFLRARQSSKYGLEGGISYDMARLFSNSNYHQAPSEIVWVQQSLPIITRHVFAMHQRLHPTKVY